MHGSCSVSVCFFGWLSTSTHASHTSHAARVYLCVCMWKPFHKNGFFKPNDKNKHRVSHPSFLIQSRLYSYDWCMKTAKPDFQIAKNAMPWYRATTTVKKQKFFFFNPHGEVAQGSGKLLIRHLFSCVCIVYFAEVCMTCIVFLFSYG